MSVGVRVAVGVKVSVGVGVSVIGRGGGMAMGKVSTGPIMVAPWPHSQHSPLEKGFFTT